MPTIGNSANSRDDRPSSTEFRVGRVTVGRWTLMRYPDEEVADECRRSDADPNEKRCASCGEEIDPTRRHPAATPPEDPSTIYLFCSDDCRTTWMANRDAD